LVGRNAECYVSVGVGVAVRLVDVVLDGQITVEAFDELVVFDRVWSVRSNLFEQFAEWGVRRIGPVVFDRFEDVGYPVRVAHNWWL